MIAQVSGRWAGEQSLLSVFIRRHIEVPGAINSNAGGVEASIFEGLEVFVDAINKRYSRTKNLWFDVTSVVMDTMPADAPRIVDRIRQLGIERMLFGSDVPLPNNVPRLAWAAFRKLPLTAAEFRAIENNVAPYVR